MSEPIRIIDNEDTGIVEVIDYRQMTDDELDEMLVSGDEAAIEEYIRRNPDVALLDE